MMETPKQNWKPRLGHVKRLATVIEPEINEAEATDCSGLAWGLDQSFIASWSNAVGTTPKCGGALLETGLLAHNRAPALRG